MAWICRRCSMPGEQHHTDLHLCVECVKAENSRVSHYRQHNYNWMDVAAEADLNVWERQPGETDHEYNVWLRYRDAYPGRKPSYRMVAEEVNTSVNAIQKIASRWSFASRMQAWAKNVDQLILAERTEQIKSMNQRHVALAESISAKLERAIEIMDPMAMSPRDIQGLFKVMTEIERKARIDQSVERTTDLDDSPDTKKDLVGSDQLTEIVAILGKAGVLQNFGVRQTTVTEVVVKDQ